jgi:hypothetical protein
MRVSALLIQRLTCFVFRVPDVGLQPGQFVSQLKQRFNLGFDRNEKRFNLGFDRNEKVQKATAQRETQ